MKTSTVLLLGGLAVVGYELIQLGTAGATLQIVFNSVNPQGLLNYNLGFLIQNISNAAINFNGLTGNVTINGNPVGVVSDFNPVVIAPVSQQQINVMLGLQLLQLPSAVTDLINNSDGNLSFEVKGNMNVDKLVLPFDVSYSFTV